MKELCLKWLIAIQRLKRSEKGFSLVELLVVIVIIGILAAIALPTFLAQSNRARESEPREYVPAINNAQEAEFATDGAFGQIDELEVGLTLDANDCTPSYCYESNPGTANGLADVITTASPVQTNSGLAGMAGRVWLDRNTEGETVVRKLFCESDVSTPPNLTTATQCP